MDSYKITCGEFRNGKYVVYEKEVCGKVLYVKTYRGIKRIGLKRSNGIYYRVTDLETGCAFANSGVFLKINNYLEAYKKAKEIFESDDYEKKLLKCKKNIEKMQRG